MPVDWKTPANTERLLACVYLWLDEKGMKVDYKRVGELLGSGVSYHAVEGTFRKVKAMAEKIRKGENTETNDMSSVSADKNVSNTRRKITTPKMSKTSGVLSGRVSKTTTPKQRRTASVKLEKVASTSNSSSPASRQPSNSIIDVTEQNNSDIASDEMQLGNMVDFDGVEDDIYGYGI